MPKDIGNVDAASAIRTIPLLFAVATRAGDTLRYTDLDVDVLHNVGDGAGVVRWAAAPGIDRGPIQTGIDLQIDDTWVRVPNVDLTLGGVTRPIAHWAMVRRFHGATVSIYRYDERSAQSFADSTWLVQGVKATLAEVEFLLESYVSRLDVQVPRTIFQPECNNAIYDLRCGADKAAFLVTSSVASATISTIRHGSLTPSAPPVLPTYANGYFNWGEVEFVSGDLIGFIDVIAAYDAAVGEIAMFQPLPAIPAPGDAIRLWPGCHKTVADCRDKFGGLRTGPPTSFRQRFRGFPYVPVFEETVGT